MSYCLTNNITMSELEAFSKPYYQNKVSKATLTPTRSNTPEENSPKYFSNDSPSDRDSSAGSFLSGEKGYYGSSSQQSLDFSEGSNFEIEYKL